MQEEAAPRHAIAKRTSHYDIKDPVGLVEKTGDCHSRDQSVPVLLEAQKPDEVAHNECGLCDVSTRKRVAAPTLASERTSPACIELDWTVAFKNILENIDSEIDAQDPNEHIEANEERTQDVLSSETVEVEEAKDWVDPDSDGVEQHCEGVHEEFKVPDIDAMETSRYRLIEFIKCLKDHSDITSSYVIKISITPFLFLYSLLKSPFLTYSHKDA